MDSLIGKEGIVKQEINNIEAQGVVKLNGMDWTARSVDGTNIPEGEKVLVDSIDGVKLMVVRKENS